MALGEKDSVALLDVLRPPQGWDTDAAWLGSYSADLVAVVACMLAMAGEGEDDREMPPTAVATALTRMADRARVVVQGGRVMLPHKGRRALVMADRWIREVHVDGNRRSWHPKVALARQVPRHGDAPARWVLWLGSRNLTRDVSWDLGLGLEGTEAPGAGRPLQGLDAMATLLARNAELPGWTDDRLVEALSTVGWQTASEGLAVRRLWVHGAGQPQGLPTPPDTADRLLAVSPFLDATTVGQFGAWGTEGATRMLATTPMALREVATANPAALDGLALRTMEAGAQDLGRDPDDPTGSEQFEETHRGLHAKALLAWSTRQDRARLWVGSANLSQRAWTGRSVEITAELELPGAAAAELWAFCDGHRFRSEHPELTDTDRDDALQPAGSPLDRLRNTLGGWVAPRLQVQGDTLVVTFAHTLPTDATAAVQVGLLGAALADWPPGTRTVQLPLPPVARWTELLHIALQDPTEAEDDVAFLLRGEWEGGIPMLRDRRVLSRLLGARAFLQWIACLLDGEPVPDEGQWPDDEGEDSHRSSGGGRTDPGRTPLRVPTIEAVLRAWMRDPSRVVEADRRITELIDHVRHEQSQEDPDEEAIEALDQLREQWATLREGLLGEAS